MSTKDTGKDNVVVIDDPLVAILTYPELLDRREYLVHRLAQLEIPAPGKGGGAGQQKQLHHHAKKTKGGRGKNETLTELSTTIPYKDKTDTHSDYLLKEMRWLSADFGAERKRHDMMRRKVCASIRAHFASLTKKRAKKLVDAELRRRKLASRIGRECVRSWWAKLDKIVTYKQKISLEKSRREAMNSQLVRLVRQTEMYSRSFLDGGREGGGSSSGAEDDEGDDPEGGHRHRRRRDRSYSIEQALAATGSRLSRRKAKGAVRDYARLLAASTPNATTDDDSASAVHSSTLYGESTEDSGSDASYAPSMSDGDDETTLREAEEEEQAAEALGRSSASHESRAREVKKLLEEESMDIDLVLERLKAEAGLHDDDKNSDSGGGDQDGSDRREFRPRGAASGAAKRVKFASAIQELSGDSPSGASPDATGSESCPFLPAPLPLPRGREADPGEDADDDGDASEVEDYLGVDEDAAAEEGEEEDDDDGEFTTDEQHLVGDDETTIALEESLPQEMSAAEEIRMLQAEGEMSIEELRARYAGALASDEGVGSKRLEIESTGEETNDWDMDVESEASEPAASAICTRSAGRSLTALLFRPGSSNEDGDDGSGDADDYEPEENDVDDETTMEAEERLGREMSYENEIAALQREGEMPIDELRAMYSRVNEAMDVEEEGSKDGEVNESSRHESAPGVQMRSFFDDANDQENDDDYVPGVEEKDDETTIAAEERLGREMTVEEEIALLQQEGIEPLEVLRERYLSLKRKRDEEDGALQSESDVESNAEESQGAASDAGRAALDALEASAMRARNTRASRPFLLAPWVRLREYQQVGLNWLVSIQSQRLNGVLADEMGLGKTLQTISLLAYLAAYKGIWGPHLIVVPTSVILNWENELKRFAPALKVLCYYGTAKRRKELRSGWTKTNWYHVVITSYQLAVQDAFAFKRKKWYYLVLDEAQHIKNFQSQRWQTLIHFNTQRRLLLTGTPLQNNLMELWSLLHFLMPYIFRSRKQFSYWFANPMHNIIEGSGSQNEDVINRLHGIIRPFVLRRLKKDVESQLPGKFEHIIKCQLSRRQMFIYEEFLSRSSTRNALTKGGNFLGMMNVLMQLRKVCNHPDLFEPRSVLTPFVTEPFRLSVPTCATAVLRRQSSVSLFMICPLWSGSDGIPSVEAALRHDTIESDELRCLEAALANEETGEQYELSEKYPAALVQLLRSLNQTTRQERKLSVELMNNVNSWRCKRTPFPYSTRLLRHVNICSSPPELNGLTFDTPAALLNMRRSQHQIADDLDETIKNFIVCVPKADSQPPIMETNANVSQFFTEPEIDRMLLQPVREALCPFRRSKARLSSFFPDRKLVQFDAGKLQTLAELLRELKRGGHRALVFTQMSKMLDILETFLNLNGHTYLRLDGSTSVERRQRLMDRFNSDPKVFCFILSTRSGGLGINLTGADSVIFYDQDWNPAMDAQAQDRAHRIGQTREVHIYRLVTEHTIEENILVKARQKRNLDILVMDKGNFDASQLFGHSESAKVVEIDDGKQVLTKGGLRSILGVEPEGNQGDASIDVDDNDDNGGLPEEMIMEKAMTSLEDADDVQALRGAQKEAADEMREFDETVEIKKGSESDEDEDRENKASQDVKLSAKKETPDEDSHEKDEEELEKEFAAWQDQVGLDADAIEASLSPTERYGLRFREVVDPYISIFAVQEYRRRMEVEAEVDDEIDIEAIEREKEREEQQAFDDGDLLCTRPRPGDLVRQRDLYRRERARLKANQKRRKLTGENWELRKDAVTKHPFWYNVDTGEAIWDKPRVLVELEAFEKAQANLFAAMPLKPLVNVMSYLDASPDRMKCAAVCRQWRSAATDPAFVLHVYPVEMGAYTRDASKMEWNHFKTISDALAAARPGDTIELGDGHYWANADLFVDFPLRIVGDESNAANVVVEMGGTLAWRAPRGFVEGVTLRRPKISSATPVPLPLVRLEDAGRVDIVECCFDNAGGTGLVVLIVGQRPKGRWNRVLIKGGNGGISLGEGASLELFSCKLKNTGDYGVLCHSKSEAKLTRCHLEATAGPAVVARSQSRVRLVKCRVSVADTRQILYKEAGASVSCSGNTAEARQWSSLSTLPHNQQPQLILPAGFRSVGDVPRHHVTDESQQAVACQ